MTDTLSQLLGLHSRVLVVALIFVQMFGCAVQSKHGRHLVTGSGGVDIAYDATGTGEVGLIFVHGWSCDRSYWREQVSTFSKNYRVITVDLGGHGESSSDRDDWSIQSFGQDVAAVAEKIDVDHVILIGHSMGGPVVLEAATQIGDRVIGVVGVDTLRNVTAEPMSQQDAEKAFDRPLEEFSKRTDALVRRIFFVETSPAVLVDEIAADMARGDAKVAAASGASLMTYNVREALTSLLDKRLVLINADYRPTNAAALKATHPNSAVSVIGNAGHFVMLEQPQEFNAVLSVELNRIIDIQ